MKQRKPAWWQLYLLLPIMLGLTLLESRYPFPGISPKLADSLIVLMTFGAMLAWVQLNLGVIERDEMQNDRSLDHLKVTVYEPQTPRNDEEKESNSWELTLSDEPASHLETVGSTQHEDEEKWRLN